VRHAGASRGSDLDKRYKSRVSDHGIVVAEFKVKVTV
jgi:hypothetical protein